jgi:hypothetical protein
MIGTDGNTAIGIGTVYGLFGPAGLLGVYTSSESARIAGDYWLEVRGLHASRPWQPAQQAPEQWHREVHPPGALRDRPQRVQDPDRHAILRVCPIPINGKPSEGW